MDEHSTNCGSTVGYWSTFGSHTPSANANGLSQIKASDLVKWLLVTLEVKKYKRDINLDNGPK